MPTTPALTSAILTSSSLNGRMMASIFFMGAVAVDLRTCRHFA
jgi:hypothetical protein